MTDKERITDGAATIGYVEAGSTVIRRATVRDWALGLSSRVLLIRHPSGSLYWLHIDGTRESASES